MKVKTSKLIGPALNHMVAVAMGHVDGYPKNFLGVRVRRFGYVRVEWDPSTDWSQGGPIIEREEIGTNTQYPRVGALEWYGRRKGSILGVGPTPLIAAMRCYVAMKLGDEVEVPDELLET